MVKKFTTSSNVARGNSFASMTLAEMTTASDLSNGTLVTVTDRGNAPFLISASGTTALTGDVTLTSGQVAVLQKSQEGKYNVTWFGAYDNQGNTVVQDAYFANAAARSGETGTVVIPAGDYKLTTAVPTSTQWELMPEAEIIGLGGVAPTYATDTTYLTGSIIRRQRAAKSAVIYVGESDYATQKARARGIVGAVSGVSAVGGCGVAGASLTSKSNTLDQASIGVTAIAFNNNTTVARTAWALYTEAWQALGASGNTFAHENAIINKNSPVQTHPNGQPGYGAGLTVGEWCSAGIGEVGDTTVTAWKAVLSAGAQYNKGLVVYYGAIAAGADYKELFATEHNSAWTWYPIKGNLNDGQPLAWIKGIDKGSSNGSIRLHIASHAAGTFSEWVANVGEFTPTTNNTENIGSTSTRIKSIFLVNSPDVSSDERLKSLRDTDGQLSAAEKAAAIAIAKLPRMFKWIDEVAKKGESAAYLHCSPMAQSVWASLEAEGLDPTLYGFISNGDTYSLQPQELLWMICAAQQDRLDSIESRLDALE